MTLKSLNSNAGFTYIAALVMVVIMGIMSAKAAEVWKTKMQREKEVELLWRGSQVREAMQRWYGWKKPAPGMQQPTQPPGVTNLMQIKDLLADPKKAGKVKYLRPSMLIDPITGKEWGIVKGDGGKIIGVKSTSDAEPIKKGNFPDEYLDFEGKKKYSEWEFVYFSNPQKVTGGQGNPNPQSSK